LRAVAEQGRTRAEYLQEQQAVFYDTAYGDDASAWQAWQSVRTDRERSYLADASVGNAQRPLRDEEGDGYAGIAVSVLESLVNDSPLRAIVDVANRGVLPFLPDEATVEVPCSVDSNGARACPVDSVPKHSRELMSRVFTAEQAAVRASRTGSRRDAVEALSLHPLVDSTARAARLFDAYQLRQPALAAVFA
jgi:6-phospho-beta-glucosidase